MTSEKDSQTKATELVHEVINKVELYPEKFDVFVGVLEGSAHFEDIVELMCKKRDQLKSAQQLAGT